MDGERLKDVRKDHQDTQETLAQKLGVSTPTVSKWEQGESDPSVSTLVRLCRLYDVSADFLLGLSDEDPLFTRKRRAALSDKSREALRQFEAFLIYQERRKNKE